MTRTKRAAITLVELLIASLIVTVTTTGAFAVWTGATINILRTNEESICAQLARTDIEKAKATGYWNLPLGTLKNGVGTLTGSTEYYTLSGASQATSTGAAYSLVRVTTDTGSGGISSNGGSYIITSDLVRTVTTTVKRLSDGSTIFTYGTEIVNNGL